MNRNTILKDSDAIREELDMNSSQFSSLKDSQKTMSRENDLTQNDLDPFSSIPTVSIII